MYCIVCHDETETKHFSLYVNGSEGIELCHSCQIAVCEFIRRMQSACNKAFKQGLTNGRSFITNKEKTT